MKKVFWVFLLIGATAFGGGTVAHLRERLVRQRGWITDEEFVGALQLGQILPGIVATNMSVILGDRLGSAFLAWLGMLLPGALFTAGLALFEADAGLREAAAPALRGVAAAAVGLLAAVAWQVGRSRLRPADLILVGITAAGSASGIPMLWLILGLGPLSIWLYRPR